MILVEKNKQNLRNDDTNAREKPVENETQYKHFVADECPVTRG